MLEDGKIDGRQAVYLNITFVIATALLAVVAIAAAKAKNDAWISSLLATFFSMGIAWLVITLGSSFPGKTLIEYQEDILGKWLGKATSFLYIVFFIHICAIMVREYGDFLMEAFFQHTPLIVFHIVVIAISAFTVKQGLEVLARVNQIVLPLIILSVFVIVSLAIPELDYKRLLPLLDTGPVKIFKGSLTPLAWHGEIIAMGMIIPFLSKPAEANKIAFKSLLVIGLLLAIAIAGGLAAFGPLTGSMSYPFLNVTRVINIAKIIDRVEPLVMVIWVAGGFVKITFFYYVSVLGTAQWMQLKDYRPLVLPVGLILVSLSIAIGEKTLDIFHFISNIFPFYALIFEAGIPLMLVIIALLRKKGGEIT